MLLELANEVFGVKAFADHHERCSAAALRGGRRGRRPYIGHLFVREHHLQRVVLRLEAAHIKNEAVRREAEALEDVGVGLIRELRAVRNDDWMRPIAPSVVRRDDFGVGNDAICEHDRHRLAGVVDGAAENVPLAAMALDAVHIDDRRNARRSQQRQHERIRRVADEHHVEIAAQCMERGQ